MPLRIHTSSFLCPFHPQYAKLLEYSIVESSQPPLLLPSLGAPTTPQVGSSNKWFGQADEQQSDAAVTSSTTASKHSRAKATMMDPTDARTVEAKPKERRDSIYSSEREHHQVKELNDKERYR